MNRVRRDLVFVNLRSRQWRLALTLLFMPGGYELWESEHRKKAFGTRIEAER